MRQANPHQRVSGRKGYVSESKPQICIAAIDMRFPQARDCSDKIGQLFLQKSIDRGARRQQVMTLAMSEWRPVMEEITYRVLNVSGKKARRGGSIGRCVRTVSKMGPDRRLRTAGFSAQRSAYRDAEA